MTAWIALGEQLKHDLLHLKELKQILWQEHEALLHRDLALLNAVIKDKNHCLSELEQHNIALKFQNNKAELQKQIADTPAEHRGSLEQLHQELLQHLESCHQLNQKNGILTRMNQQHTKAILEILKGKSASDILPESYRRPSS